MLGLKETRKKKVIGERARMLRKTQILNLLRRREEMRR